MATDAQSSAEPSEPGQRAFLLAAQLKRTSRAEDSPDLHLLHASGDPLSLRRHIQAGPLPGAPLSMGVGDPPFWLAAIPSGEARRERKALRHKARALRKWSISAPIRIRQRRKLPLERFEPDAIDRLLAIDLLTIKRPGLPRWPIGVLALGAIVLYLWLQGYLAY